MSKPRINPDLIAQAAAYYQSGHTLLEASNLIGCNQTTLAKYLRRMHVTRPVGSKRGNNTVPDPDNQRAARVSLMTRNLEQGFSIWKGITDD